MQFLTIVSAVLATMVGVTTANPSAQLKCLNAGSQGCVNATSPDGSDRTDQNCCESLVCNGGAICINQGSN